MNHFLKHSSYSVFSGVHSPATLFMAGEIPHSLATPLSQAADTERSITNQIARVFTHNSEVCQSSSLAERFTRQALGTRPSERAAARAVPAARSPPSPLPSADMTERKAVIKNADMSEDMQQDAVDMAMQVGRGPPGIARSSACPLFLQAMEKFNIEKDIAAYIKKEFDKKYNPTWHCIVGRNFGSYVTHETKHFIYFYLGQVAVLLFKSG